MSRNIFRFVRLSIVVYFFFWHSVFCILFMEAISVYLRRFQCVASHHVAFSISLHRVVLTLLCYVDWHCIVLYCIVLCLILFYYTYHIGQYYIVLNHTVIYCIVLNCTVYNILYCVLLHFVPYWILLCSIILCRILLYRVLF